MNVTQPDIRPVRQCKVYTSGTARIDAYAFWCVFTFHRTPTPYFSNPLVLQDLIDWKKGDRYEETQIERK